MNFSEMVYKETKKIPEGKVSTYYQIARSIGKPKASRAVGQTLSKNPYSDVPCHRVVKATGEVGGFKGSSENMQKISILIKEGVEIKDKKIDLNRFLAPHV